MQLGKLEKIDDLRRIWPHEALDFTPWLAEDENLSLLCDAVGIDMTIDETRRVWDCNGNSTNTIYKRSV